MHAPRPRPPATHETDDEWPDLVLLVYDIVEELQRGEAWDLLTEEHTVLTARAVEESLRRTGCRLEVAPVRDERDLRAALRGRDLRNTLVFNLCEALGGLSSGEARVPVVLEELGALYQGASADNISLCLDKGAAKASLAARGIATPAFQVFCTGDEFLQLPLPLIVKPLTEHCSMGINESSVVADEPSLRSQLQYVLSVYRQPALVEEFLPGREFSVCLWGNGDVHAFGMSEVDYSASDEALANFRHFEAKWTDSWPVHCPAMAGPELERRLRATAIASYETLGCRDYARVDVREKDGVPHVLDVNPNPSLAPDDGFANAAAVIGMDFAGMLSKLIKLAWARAADDT